MKNTNSWLWEIGFCLFFGLPVYLSVLPILGFQTSFLIHIVTVAIYAVLIAQFGRKSAIEMGVRVAVLIVLAAILFPVYHRAETNKQRHQQRHRENP